MKSLILSLLLTFFVSHQISAQSISFQQNYVGEYSYQNVDAAISFTKYSLQYKFEKPFLIQFNTESAEYYDSFENKFAYTYIGFGIGTYTQLYKGLNADFGISFQKAFKREFSANSRLFLYPNRGSKTDMEKYRGILFGNLSYEQIIYKRLGLSLGVGIESILNPYPSAGYFGYNNQTNTVNDTGDYASGISTYYTVSLGIIYNLSK